MEIVATLTGGGLSEKHVQGLVYSIETAEVCKDHAMRSINVCGRLGSHI